MEDEKLLKLQIPTSSDKNKHLLEERSSLVFWSSDIGRCVAGQTGHGSWNFENEMKRRFDTTPRLISVDCIPRLRWRWKLKTPKFGMISLAPDHRL